MDLNIKLSEILRIEDLKNISWHFKCEFLSLKILLNNHIHLF